MLLGHLFYGLLKRIHFLAFSIIYRCTTFFVSCALPPSLCHQCRILIFFLPFSLSYKDPCDCIESTQIIQDNLSISRSYFNYTFRVPFAVCLPYLQVPGNRKWTFLSIKSNKSITDFF